jgi:hypothetical protein
MDQHPIPRQITTFEFKLIGFMTLKQFLYLAIFCPIGYIAYSILPFPIVLKILIGILIGAIGAAFAFIPIQDRPLDVFIKNFIRRLSSPSQYMYKKQEEAIYFLKDIFFVGDPHIALAHAESKEKLREYLQTQQKQSKAQMIDTRDKQKSHIEDLLKQNLEVPQLNQQTRDHQPHVPREGQQIMNQPFVTGMIKNRKQIPIPGILVTIKNQEGAQLRILKTNPYGIFATYSPLPVGDYMFEVGDPNGNYFFDTMNVHIDPNNQRSILIYSKEIL